LRRGCSLPLPPFWMHAEASSEKRTLTSPAGKGHPMRKLTLTDVSSDGSRLLPYLLGSRKDGGRAHVSGALRLDARVRILKRQASRAHDSLRRVGSESEDPKVPRRSEVPCEAGDRPMLKRWCSGVLGREWR
jgi:hypothetical protein